MELHGGTVRAESPGEGRGSTFVVELPASRRADDPAAPPATGAVPDVLVSDIGMPDEDRLSMIRRIRTRPADHGGRVPALAVTGYARGEDQHECRSAGFDDHISKPVEMDDLLGAIARLAGRVAV